MIIILHVFLSLYDQIFHVDSCYSLSARCRTPVAAQEIVQVIYEKDYRFAQPPKTPTLTASPGDGYVMLSWNDDADKLTRDPFIGNVNDFDGIADFVNNEKIDIIVVGPEDPLVNGIKDYFENNSEFENLLIVAHSGVIRSILAHEISENFEHYWKFNVENCKLAVIEYTESYHYLTALNI